MVHASAPVREAFEPGPTSSLRRPRNPVGLLLWGYISYIVAGWLVLCLPICQKSSQATVLDHLFTATSAVSTTGLITVSTGATYTLAGQAVVALLIQFGGLGYMTIGSFVMVAVGQRISMTRTRVSEIGLSPPSGISVARFIRSIIIFTVAIETVGACALLLIFSQRQVPDAWWSAVFHSISAFCTAGFSLFDDSFVSYRAHLGLNLVIIALSYCGAVGFIVLNDLHQRLRRRKLRLSLSSRVILWCTFWLSLFGTLLLAFDEPTLRSRPLGENLLAALFQAMTASTTVGFNTVDIGALSAGSVFLITIIMVVGASPAGTGGGIKTTTLATLWATMISVFRRRERTNFGDRELPPERVRLATVSAVFYLFLLCLGIYALSLVESAPLPDQVVECASAIGTVGLSRGITADLTWAGKLIVIVLMFAGRVGPLALGMTLLQIGRRQPLYYFPREDLAI
ncbi:MAG: potassium transporter TrkG [Planctomycetota bacterium]